MINSKLAFGTAAIGRPMYINIKEDTVRTEDSLEAFRQKGLAVLDAAYNSGIRYFDTAPGYGTAEQMLMDWVIDKNDAYIEIASKWGYTYVADFDVNATVHELKEHSLGKLNEQWTKSKVLLPLLTSYQIHSATFETGVLENEKILRRMAELKQEHNLMLGLTTTGANQLEVVNRALDVEVDGLELFSLFQVTYNIFDQSIASVASEITRRNKRLVIKEALANARALPNDSYPNYASAYKLLRQLEKKYNVGADAIALRFCIDSIPVYKVLSGASNILHLIANMEVSKFKLEEADIEALKDLAVSPSHYWLERQKLNWN